MDKLQGDMLMSWRRLYSSLQEDENHAVLRRVTSIRDDRCPEEQQHVDALRRVLKSKDLLQTQYDEYHVLLRSADTV